MIRVPDLLILRRQQHALDLHTLLRAHHVLLMGAAGPFSAADFLTPFIAVQALLSNFPRARQEQASFSGQINLQFLLC